MAGLTNMLSLAPFSEVAIFAAFQHMGQIYNHYGPHDGYAVLRSFKTMVFLPGLDQRTTESAFNAIQHGAIDERGEHTLPIRRRVHSKARASCLSAPPTCQSVRPPCQPGV
jgi:hypothetical protein